MKEPPSFFYKILELLHERNYAAKIARLLGLSGRKVHYWVKKAQQLGLIQLDKKDVAHFYRLSQKGREYLDYKTLRGSDKDVFSRVFRLHNFGMKYRVLEGPKVVVDWRKVELQNWDKLVGSVLGVTVELTTKHLVIHADTVRGRDPWKLLFMCYRECERVANYVEQSMGMRLEVGELLRKPHWGIEDEGANVLSQFMEITDGVAKIDESEGHGEIDWFSPDAAKNYLLTFTVLPNMMRRQQVDINEVKEVLTLFGKELKTHLSVMRGIDKSVKSLDKSVANLQKGTEELRETIRDLKPKPKPVRSVRPSTLAKIRKNVEKTIERLRSMEF